MIIAVWGNSASGKSTVAIKMAQEFASQKKNVILIDTNFIAPQAKIWFPKEDVLPENSMTTILSNNIELDSVASKITMVNDFLGFLGYARDLSVNSLPSRNDTPASLLTTLEEISDVIIVDCQTNVTQDILTFTALDEADAKVICMTPDLRGLSWYEANVIMLKEKWSSQAVNVFSIFSKVKVNSPADALEKVIGNIDYYLPFYDEIEEELYIGTMGSEKYKGHSKKYGQIINTLCEDINDKYAEKQQSIRSMIFENQPSEEIFDNGIDSVSVDDIHSIFEGPQSVPYEEINTDDDFDFIEPKDMFTDFNSNNNDNSFDDFEEIPIVNY